MSALVRCGKCGAANRVDLTRLGFGKTAICGTCSDPLSMPTRSLIKRPLLFPEHSFIMAHWRGEYSLAFSYWIVSFLTNLSVLVVTFIISEYLDSQNAYNPLLLWVGNVLIWAFLISITFWHIVGTWRSADRFSADPHRKNTLWGGVAKFFLIMGGIKMIGQLPTVYRDLGELSQMAFFNDSSIPDYKLTVTEGGKEIKLEGGFKYGLSQDLKRLMLSAPSARIVNLESVGGRIAMGEEIAKVIEEYNFGTVSNSGCFSACTIAFLAGKERFLGIDGRLGFHAGAFAGVESSESKSGEYAIYRGLTAKYGTSSAFIRKILATPHDKMWYPDRDELVKERIITARSSTAPSSVRLLAARLKDVEQEVRRTLPSKLSDDITITDVYTEGNRFVYVYDVDRGLHTLFRQPEVLKAQKESVEEAVCAKTSMAKDMSKGIIYGYYYRDKVTKEKSGYFELSSCRDT